jgi:hypothetical protein
MVYKIMYKKYILRPDVRHNQQYIYVFGDNDRRSGLGGQAKEMRGEPNAIGIRVKKSPSMEDSAFYTDAEYDENVRKITEDLNKLAIIANTKEGIVFPEDGIGTGMALLFRTAPQTFAYLSATLNNIFGITNGDISQYETLFKAVNKKLRPDRDDIIELRKKQKRTISKIIRKKPIKRCICKPTKRK